MALLAAALSCAPPAPGIDPRTEREGVLAAIERLWDAYARQDLEGQERLYAPEAVQIGERRSTGRTAILRYLRRWYRGRQIQAWAHTQREVEIIGDVAIASYWDEETGLLDGEPYRISCWVSDVWVRRDGSWVNLLSHFGTNQAAEPGFE